MKAGWREAAFNTGWTYRDRVPRAAAGTLVSEWLADRYRHSDAGLWQQRIAAGELDWNEALPSTEPVVHSFTPREASVLQLVAEGLMNKEIARQLETSIRNVEKYVSRLFNKTGTSSRTELVRYALEHRLVT